jgi:hypothetical protein
MRSGRTATVPERVLNFLRDHLGETFPNVSTGTSVEGDCLSSCYLDTKGTPPNQGAPGVGGPRDWGSGLAITHGVAAQSGAGVG